MPNSFFNSSLFRAILNLKPFEAFFGGGITLKRYRHLLLITVLAVGFVLGIPITAQAAKTTNTIPKTLRGTWYFYVKGEGYDKYKLTTHTLTESLVTAFETKKEHHYSAKSLRVVKFKKAYYIWSSNGTGISIGFNPGKVKVSGKYQTALAVDGLSDKTLKKGKTSTAVGDVYTSFKTKKNYTIYFN